MMRRTHVYPAALVAIVALNTGCSDSSSGPSANPFNDLATLIVSPPLAIRSATGAGASGTGVYVSLRPGTVPGGASASIRKGRAADALTIALVDGGFDPVAIAASVGDTVFVDITKTGTSQTVFGWKIVTAIHAPQIVRTSPGRGEANVPLNTTLLVVLSAPMDSSTVDTGSIRLSSGPTPILGSVRFSDASHLRAEFLPATPLTPRPDYQLLVTQRVRDESGLALDSALIVPFAAGPSTTALVFASVSVGFQHACGVTTSGAGYCWGGGALGTDSVDSSTTPVPVSGGLTFAMVSAGYYHTCGVTTAGALYCWGGGYVPLGTGSPPQTGSATPVAVSPRRSFASVSVEMSSACAVTTAGAAFCWGDNDFGELGDGTVQEGGVDTLVAVAGGLTFKSVTAGGCGVTLSGAAYCWGNNEWGQLGTGVSGSPPPPQCDSNCGTGPNAVTGGLAFRHVDAQGVCGVATNGRAYCWGNNSADRLGLGTLTGPEVCTPIEGSEGMPCSRSPAAVPGVSNMVSISSSSDHTCGLTASGVAYCWGVLYEMNDYSPITTAVAVPGSLIFATLNTGTSSACAVTAAGVAYCWGSNDHGQLGDGTKNVSITPVKVAGQP